MQQIPLAERAQGRWASILPAIGVDRAHLSAKHGPCPMCGGRDRFRFDNKEGRGTWICSHCGAGSGIDLVMRKMGLDFKEAARRIESVMGDAPREDPKPVRSEQQLRDDRNKLWRGARPVQADDPVDRYLNARGIPEARPTCLRTALRTIYTGDEPSFHPVMLAMVHGADGKPATLHRTYLGEHGDKAALDEPRRIMPGGHPKGSAVRLSEVGPVLGIAEGIETAMSAEILFGIPCWAALTADMLEAWSPPEGVSEVFIFGDNDVSFTGQRAAFGLARRMFAAKIRARVEIPILVGTDWNDTLRARGARAPAQTQGIPA